MSFLSAERVKAKFSPTRLKAKIEPHLHWQVPFKVGIYANSPKWCNPGTD